VKKILVIEDDPINAQILQDFLAANGYATEAASSGIEGLERFRADRPDLLLVDVQLPRKNGFEVCTEVKTSPEGRDLPVLLMSAVYTDREHVDRMTGSGRGDATADGYLTKPFDLVDLLARVRGLIGTA
jgi:two-component system, OmpR family, response regulator MprA